MFDIFNIVQGQISHLKDEMRHNKDGEARHKGEGPEHADRKAYLEGLARFHTRRKHDKTATLASLVIGMPTHRAGLDCAVGSHLLVEHLPEKTMSEKAVPTRI